MLLLLALCWAATVLWLILRALRQRGLLQPLPAPPVPPAASLAVIVPARDEEANIAACLGSLLAQDYPRDRLSLLAVDDGSRDRTAELAAALAARDDRLALVAAGPLPPGWTGKSHACWTGVAALQGAPDWLCFIDADMRAGPGLLSAAVAAAEAQGLDLLSLAPRHRLVGFAERLMIPTGLYALAFSQDLAGTAGTAPAGGGRGVQARGVAAAPARIAANGQFMLVRRQAYLAVGGHEAVRAAICEDLELARRFLRAGCRIGFLDAGAMLETRMYSGWRSLWPGFAKNLTEMLGGPARTLAVAAAAPVLAWASLAVPALALAALLQEGGGTTGRAADWSAVVLACAATGAVVGLHLTGARHFRIPLWYGLLYPLGYTIGAALALDAVRRRLRGQVYWKGRSYRAAAADERGR